MKREKIEKYLGKNVEITLFDDDIIKGEFHKTSEEQFNGNPIILNIENIKDLINSICDTVIEQKLYLKIIEGTEMYYGWYVNILKEQLKAHKDKEDKLRELFEKKPRYDKEKKQHILRVGTMEEILKILDGSDE